ncbi:CHAP domain-containing protein [Streptomyces sp. NPDC002659]|uniref:CHAP domain-containing protein n=1 Tax=Streptomyces sp. NPDC002659 TaxID=3364656 RepID=UPI003688744B
MRRLSKSVLVTGVSAGLLVGSLAMAGPARASSLGDSIARQANGQLDSQNKEVQKRRLEGGKKHNNNCNFYSGFWNKGARKGLDGAKCGTTMGYRYERGVKKWTPIAWGSQAWCADFAKFAWYWGKADVAGINSLASSFKGYGDRHHTWHPRGSYTPKPGDAVTYDRDHDGTIDHVGVVVNSNKSKRTYSSVEGNVGVKYGNNKKGEGLLRKTGQSAVNTDVVGFTTPVSKK